MRKLLGSLAYALSCALAAACAALLLLVCGLVSSAAASALRLAPTALAVTRLLPARLAFWGALSTPLGGVFRTDFALAAAALLAAAWAARRVARWLR